MTDATVQHIMDILLEMKSDISEMKGTLGSVEDQCLRTNGRVSKLEERAGAVDDRDRCREGFRPDIVNASEVAVLAADLFDVNDLDC